MVIQNISTDGKKTDVTFTIKRDDSKNAISLIKNNKKIKYENIYMNDKVSKISIVGAGMVATPGVTYKMFRGLANEKINILSISTSEIKLSVIISEEDTLKEQVRNREKSEIEHFIADTIRKRVGERIHSRLKEMCYFENLIGKDRRISEDEIDE